MARLLCAAAVFFATVVTAAPTSTPPAAPPPKGPTPEQIRQAIDDLASPRFAVRERASKLLWEAGRAAEADLRVAAKGKDEEAANRAKAILEKFDWGLYPDTPAEIVKLIERFRGGDPDTRQQVVGELMRLETVPVRRPPQGDRQRAGRGGPHADVRADGRPGPRGRPGPLGRRPSGRGQRAARDLPVPEQPAEPGRLRHVPTPAQQGARGRHPDGGAAQEGLPGRRPAGDRGSRLPAPGPAGLGGCPRRGRRGQEPGAAKRPGLGGQRLEAAGRGRARRAGRRRGGPRGQGRLPPAGREQGQVRRDHRRTAQGFDGRRGGRRRRLHPGLRPVAQRPGGRRDRRPQGAAQAGQRPGVRPALRRAPVQGGVRLRRRGQEGAGRRPTGGLRAAATRRPPGQDPSRPR